MASEKYEQGPQRMLVVTGTLVGNERGMAAEVQGSDSTWAGNVEENEEVAMGKGNKAKGQREVL